MFRKKDAPPPPDFSDDESIPPPPPLPDNVNEMNEINEMESFHDNNSNSNLLGNAEELKEVPSSGTAKPVKKWRLLKKEAEHVLIPQDETAPTGQEQALNTNTNTNTASALNSNSSSNEFPMQGHFRGMHHAQQFDEEEAGMDEIEVPSSSVVARMNKSERKMAKRKKCSRIAILVLIAVVVLIGIVTGSVLGTRGGTGENEVNNNQNGNPGGNNDNDNNGGDNNGNGNGNNNGNGDGTNPNPNPNPEPEPEPEDPKNPDMNTAAGRFISSNQSISPTIKQRLNDPDSSASKALAWVLHDPVNANHGFHADNDNDDAEDVFASEEMQLDFTQRLAVAALGEALGSTNMGNNMNWMSEQNVCLWHGIECGTEVARDQRDRNMNENADENTNTPADMSKVVTRIIMPNNIAAGTIPNEIGLFSNLEQLILYNDQGSLTPNKITGSIPEELYDLTELTALDLYNNEITGSISPKIGNFHNLIGLYLAKNKLSGPIPTEIADMASIEAIWLFDNILEGPIPSELGDASNLQELYLGDNQLTGGLPQNIANAPLTELSLDDNPSLFLTAPDGDSSFPEFLLTMPYLTRISLRNVNLTGNIPSFEDSAITATLEKLYLDDNLLTGELIDASIGSLGGLTKLRLSNNVELGGEIPEELGQLEQLSLVDLRNCRFTGEIPEDLGDAVSLTHLYLSSNYLEGDIPRKFGQLVNLRSFEFDLNDIDSVPTEVCEIGIEVLLGGCDVDCDCCTDECRRLAQ